MEYEAGRWGEPGSSPTSSPLLPLLVACGAAAGKRARVLPAFAPEPTPMSS